MSINELTEVNNFLNWELLNLFGECADYFFDLFFCCLAVNWDKFDNCLQSRNSGINFLSADFNTVLAQTPDRLFEACFFWVGNLLEPR